jgi:plastocyanin
MRGLGAMVALAISMALPAAEPVTVDIVKFAFTPKEITVAPGTTVVWINHDETPHTVAASDHGFASKPHDTDARYEHTFVDEGDIPYFCTVHPFMTGVVHVRKP